jgi:hypothetical protein
MVQLTVDNHDLIIHAHRFGFEHFPQLEDYSGLLYFSELGHLVSEIDLSLMCCL